ncbi:MAG TPA: tetratricopeptide repeat protein [Myxococcales bacterium]|nr:tetratricopeptide repeat protein [Myxococcales bacterium]HIL81224.1 tetratricopeptide repeat protein [Myxococcales bacterium]
MGHQKDNRWTLPRWRGARHTFLLFVLAHLWLPLGCEQSDPVAEIRRMQAVGSYQASIAPLRELIKSRPDDAEIFFLYGVALSRVSLPTQAVWPLVKAMESPDWYPEAALFLANVATTTSDWGMALGVLDPFLEQEPENSTALILRAYVRAQSRQNYEGALSDAEIVLEQEPDNSEALVIRGVALLGLGRVEEAGEAIEAAGDHFETAGLGLADSPHFCSVRATFAKEKGEVESAEEIFEKCLEAYPASFLVTDEAVKFFDSIGRWDRSFEIIRAAFDAAPAVRSYRSSLVYRLSAQGEYDEAEKILLEATVAPQPEEAASAFADLAGYYFQHEEFDKSIDAFEQALALLFDPRPDFLFAYADALVVAGRYEKALAVAEDMTVLPHRELIRGRALLGQGNPTAALEHFGKGLELWPENTIGRYLTAIAAEQVGDFDRAIEEFRYAIRAGSSETDARLRLAKLYAASGNPDAGLDVIRHEAHSDPQRSLTETIFEIELLGRVGRPDKLSPHIMEALKAPRAWARAVAAMAAGVREAKGPQAAADVILRSEKTDLTYPLHAAALSSLVMDLVALGRGKEALARTDAALGLHPNAPALHAVKGQALSLSGGDEKAVRAAWMRATELDPENALALRGLAALEAAGGEPAAALALYRRAANAEVVDGEALRGAAALLIAQGRRAEAKQELERLLEREPYDGAAALQLAQLLLEEDRGATQPRTIVLLKKAERFRGGAEASRLLKQSLELRDAEPPSS